MHLFYQPIVLSDKIQLTEEESKHAVRVLRLKKGDMVDITDGKGLQAKARIEDDNPKKCVLEIVSRIQHKPNRTYKLHIVVAPTKNIERIEWFIEKATEMGIDSISFMETENSERSRIKLDRCEKIAVSAMKQSKQWFVPALNDIRDFKTVLAQNTNQTEKYIAWCETPQTEFLPNLILKKANNSSLEREIIVLIGPEGDFSAAETTLAQQSGYVPVSLGNTILRTETAALFACAAIKTILPCS